MVTFYIYHTYIASISFSESLLRVFTAAPCCLDGTSTMLIVKRLTLYYSIMLLMASQRICLWSREGGRSKTKPLTSAPQVLMVTQA